MSRNKLNEIRSTVTLVRCLILHIFTNRDQTSIFQRREMISSVRAIPRKGGPLSLFLFLCLALRRSWRRERRTGAFCDIHYRWQVVSAGNTIMAAVDPTGTTTLAVGFPHAGLLAGPGGTHPPGKLYSYLGDYAGDPPSLHRRRDQKP